MRKLFLHKSFCSDFRALPHAQIHCVGSCMEPYVINRLMGLMGHILIDQASNLVHLEDGGIFENHIMNHDYVETGEMSSNSHRQTHVVA
jgi:hypothetical protein